MADTTAKKKRESKSARDKRMEEIMKRPSVVRLTKQLEAKERAIEKTTAATAKLRLAMSKSALAKKIEASDRRYYKLADECRCIAKQINKEITAKEEGEIVRWLRRNGYHVQGGRGTRCWY